MGGRSHSGASIALAVLLAACTPGPEGDAATAGTGGSPPRAGRFGSLRDFVLMDLPPVAPGGARRWLFVDRFEVTRADWGAFVATAAGRAVDADTAAWMGDPGLPVGMVDLRQARAFARWRFGRLPTREEWLAVATGGGRYSFPWGNKAEATRANTAELGLGEPTLVGLFESGRRGDQPYDLVGNVSEWTESVSPSWWTLENPADALVLPPLFGASREAALAAEGLAVWQLAPGVAPPCAVAVARPAHTPVEVLGADFQRAMQELDRVNLVEAVLAGDRRLRTGLRVFAAPVELLRALLVADVVPAEDDTTQLERFVARGAHRAVLRAGWAEATRGLDPSAREGELFELLRLALGE